MENPNQVPPTPQPAQSPQQPKKWYYHKGILAIIILTLIASTVVWVYFIENQPQDFGPLIIRHKTASQNQQPNPLSSASNSNYANSTLNFSFNYPSQLTVEDASNNGVFGLLIVDKNKTGAGITISTPNSNDYSLDAFAALNVSTSPSFTEQDVTINRNSGVVYSFVGALGNFKGFMFKENNITYRILALNPDKLGYNVFDVITQSFYFTK